MDYEATVKFTGVVGGVEVLFHPGDIIAAADAAEMNLAAKPDLAVEVAE